MAQPECLELLVVDGGSTDGCTEMLRALSAEHPRLRTMSRVDAEPACGLNQAFRAARGTLIGWINPDDLYPAGALARAVRALEENREWLMVYGDGEKFDNELNLIQRYPTLPASMVLRGFRSHCFICQPSVVFRRSMGLLLGEFDKQWRTGFKVDFLLRALSTFPHRIGYLPHLQGRTRLHSTKITSQQKSQMALEAIKLFARHFGSTDTTGLINYAQGLKLGLAALPEGKEVEEHLKELFEQARTWLPPHAAAQLQRSWLAANSPLPPQSVSCDWKPSGLQETTAAAVVQFHKRPFGVNLIGHAFEVFGIGEDVRMAAGALQAAGVPCCVIYHPAANGVAESDRTLEPLVCGDVAGGPYAFNLVCMAAPIQARWLRQSGCEPLRERYTLCSWPWETQQWPKALMPLLDVADELWPSSCFTAAALAGPATEAARPLHVMPMAAEIPDPDRFCSAAARTAARARHGLPIKAVLFGYGFDLNSTAVRKNPMAALEAFQLAFPLPHLPSTFGQERNAHPLSRQVALLIKTFPPQNFSAEWHWLQARAAEDFRIKLIAESLPREELLALYGCCDVFLSLHRSEGFGRGIAEALQLGVDVIATDFGGNTDFCTGPLAHPIGYRTAPVPLGAYPYADSHCWAEPDLVHAAKVCRQVAALRLAIARDDPEAAPSHDPAVLASYRTRFSFASVGARYRARLEALWADHRGVDARLRWRAVRSPMGR